MTQGGQTHARSDRAHLGLAVSAISPAHAEPALTDATTANKTYSTEIEPPVAPTVKNGFLHPTINYDSRSQHPIDLASLVTSGDHTGFKIVSQPSAGTVVDNFGYYYYQLLGTDFVGTDSFKFIALNGSLESAEATVYINVYPPPPFMQGGGISTNFNASGSLDLEKLKISGHVSKFELRTSPSNGTAIISGNTVTYTPSLDYHGSDSFTFVAIGGGGTSAQGTIMVDVKPPVPTLADGSIAVDFNASKTLDLC